MILSHYNIYVELRYYGVYLAYIYKYGCLNKFLSNKNGVIVYIFERIYYNYTPISSKYTKVLLYFKILYIKANNFIRYGLYIKVNNVKVLMYNYKLK